MRSGFTFRILFTVFAAILLSCPAAAQDSVQDLLTEGEQWLVEQQHQDDGPEQGRFGASPSALIDTQEVFKTLMHLGGEMQPRVDALNWVYRQSPKDFDGLARQLEILSVSTAAFQPLVDKIIAAQNQDGGWGLSSKYQSAPFHTLNVFNAFTYFNLVDEGSIQPSVIESILNYFENTQHISGGWVLDPAEGGNTFLTASVLYSVTEHLIMTGQFQSGDLNALISNASAWLLEQKNPDGSFGSTEDVLITALAFSALLRASIYIETISEPDLSPALEYLKQSFDAEQHNWNGSLLDTAFALRALRDSQLIELLTPADIAVHPFSISPQNPTVDQAVLISIMVENSGERQQDDVTFHISSDNPDFPEESWSFGTMYGGDTRTINLDYTLPAGTYNLHAEVNSADRNPLNDFQDVQFTIQPLSFPDLTITADDISFSNPEPAPGEPVDITTIIHNVGGADAAGFKVRFFDGNRQQLYDIYLGEKNVPSLAAGTSVSLTLPAVQFIGSQVGLREIFVYVDYDDTVEDEISEENNFSFKHLLIDYGPLPDATITSLFLNPVSPTAWSPVQLQAQVSNIGPGEAQHMTLGFYQGDPEQRGILIDQVNDIALASGAAHTYSVSWTPTEGPHHIYAVINRDQVRPEEDVTNNRISVATNVAPAAGKPVFNFKYVVAKEFISNNGENSKQATPTLEWWDPRNIEGRDPYGYCMTDPMGAMFCMPRSHANGNYVRILSTQNESLIHIKGSSETFATRLNKGQIYDVGASLQGGTLIESEKPLLALQYDDFIYDWKMFLLSSQQAWGKHYWYPGIRTAMCIPQANGTPYNTCPVEDKPQTYLLITAAENETDVTLTLTDHETLDFPDANCSFSAPILNCRLNKNETIAIGSEDRRLTESARHYYVRGVVIAEDPREGSRIVSNRPIQVHAFSAMGGFHSAGYLVLPDEILGSDYFVPYISDPFMESVYLDTDFDDRILIVASQNNTTVTVEESGLGEPVVLAQRTLNQGETWQYPEVEFEAKTNNGNDRSDFPEDAFKEGTRIHSDKPIGVVYSSPTGLWGDGGAVQLTAVPLSLSDYWLAVGGFTYNKQVMGSRAVVIGYDNEPTKIIADRNLNGAYDQPQIDQFTQSDTFRIENESLVSNPIEDRQTAVIYLKVTGPQSIQFDWKMESETNDAFTFSVDESTQLVRSGMHLSWTTSDPISIPLGEHLLKWEYRKDEKDSAGSDRVWIDNIEVNGTIIDFDDDIPAPEFSFEGGRNMRSEADYNGDFTVDYIDDGLFWNCYYADPACTPSDASRSDFDGNGTIDDNDWYLMLDCYGSYPWPGTCQIPYTGDFFDPFFIQNETLRSPQIDFLQGKSEKTSSMIRVPFYNNERPEITFQFRTDTYEYNDYFRFYANSYSQSNSHIPASGKTEWKFADFLFNQLYSNQEFEFKWSYEWTGNDDDSDGNAVNAIWIDTITVKDAITGTIKGYYDFTSGLTGAGSGMNDIFAFTKSEHFQFDRRRMRSAPIPANGLSSAELMIELSESGSVQFDWEFQAAPGDIFRFYVDQEERLLKSGNNQVQQKISETFNLSGGTHVLKWEYRKNSDTAAFGEDAIWIDNILVKEGDTDLHQFDFEEDYGPDFKFDYSRSDRPYDYKFYNDKGTFRSPVVQKRGTLTAAELTVQLTEPASVQFDYHVEMNEGRPDGWGPYFRFYVCDGESCPCSDTTYNSCKSYSHYIRTQATGVDPVDFWHHESQQILAPGTYTLRWEYDTDYDRRRSLTGDDAIWLDNIQIQQQSGRMLALYEFEKEMDEVFSINRGEQVEIMANTDGTGTHLFSLHKKPYYLVQANIFPFGPAGELANVNWGLTVNPGKPDFVVRNEDIRISSASANIGDLINVQATVQNIELQPASEVQVRFYDGDPEENGIWIGSDLISELEAGGHAEVSTSHVFLDGGSHEIYVVVDPNNFVLEADETNNSGFGTIEISEPVYPLNIATDRPTYAPGETITLDALLENPSQLPIEGTLQFDILDNGMHVISGAYVAPHIFSRLASEDSLSVERTWISFENLEDGPYHARVRYIRNKIPKTEAVADFSILVPNAQITPSVTTDRVSYSSNDTVHITLRVKNLSSNYTFHDLMVRASVVDPGNNTIHTFAPRAIPRLLPNGLQDFSVEWKTLDTPPGKDFQVRMDVLQSSLSKGSDATAFEIESSVQQGKGIKGLIQALPSEVDRGKITVLNYTVTNIGNSDLTGLALNIYAVDPKTDTTVLLVAKSNLQLAKTQTQAFSDDYLADLEPGTYMLALEGRYAGNQIPIARTHLIINEVLDDVAPSTWVDCGPNCFSPSQKYVAYTSMDPASTTSISITSLDVEIPADLDQDGDVADADYALFTACKQNPSLPECGSVNFSYSQFEACRANTWPDPFKSIIYHPEYNPREPSLKNRIDLCLNEDLWSRFGWGILKWAGITRFNQAFHWYGNCRKDEERDAGGWNAPPRYQFDLTRHNPLADYGDRLPPSIDCPLFVTDRQTGIENIRFTIDDVDLTRARTYSSPFSLVDEGLAEGFHVIRAWAIDQAGNDASSQTFFTTFGITLDGTPPGVTAWLSGHQWQDENTLYVNQNSPLIVSASDALSGLHSLSIQLDQPPFNVVTASSYWSYTQPWTEGPHTIQYSGLDHVNNRSIAQEMRFTSDATPPSVTQSISGPTYLAPRALHFYMSHATTITWEAIDSLSGMKVLNVDVNGTKFESTTAPWQISVNTWSNGPQEITFSAQDNVSNSSATQTETMILDGSAPTWNAWPWGYHYDSGSSLFIGPATKLVLYALDNAFNSVQSGVKEMRLDIGNGEGFFTVPAESDFARWISDVFSEGAHVIQIEVEDQVQNIKSDLFNFNVDSTPPDIQVRVNGTPQSSLDFTIAPGNELTIYAMDLGSGVRTFSIELDGVSQSVQGTQWAHSGWTHGETHELEILSDDNVRNQEGKTLTIHVVGPDTTAPQSSISVTPPAYNGQFISWNPQELFTVSIDATDPERIDQTTSGVDFLEWKTSVDGSYTNQSGPGPVLIKWANRSDLTEGNISFTARATDHAGNTEQPDATLPLTIDNTPPDFIITANGVTQTGPLVYLTRNTRVTIEAVDAASGTKTLHVRVDADGSTIANESTPGSWQSPVWDSGEYQISYSAEDQVGNMSAGKSVTVQVQTKIRTVLAMDESGSMDQSGSLKFRNMTNAVREFVYRFNNEDRMGLLWFDGNIRRFPNRTPLADLSSERDSLVDNINSYCNPNYPNDPSKCNAEGSTNLYDSIALNHSNVSASNGGGLWWLKKQTADDSFMEALIVLSDGADTVSSVNLNNTRIALNSYQNGRPFVIFTIGYEPTNVAKRALIELATNVDCDAPNPADCSYVGPYGRYFDADSADVDCIYCQIGAMLGTDADCSSICSAGIQSSISKQRTSLSLENAETASVDTTAPFASISYSPSPYRSWRQGTTVIDNDAKLVISATDIAQPDDRLSSGIMMIEYRWDNDSVWRRYKTPVPLPVDANNVSVRSWDNFENVNVQKFQLIQREIQNIRLLRRFSRRS